VIAKSTPVFTAVQVTREDHPRHGQAGYIVGNDPQHPDSIAVKFDSDGAEEAIALADLRTL
jgi:hypothetical protein